MPTHSEAFASFGGFEAGIEKKTARSAYFIRKHARILASEAIAADGLRILDASDAFGSVDASSAFGIVVA